MLRQPVVQSTQTDVATIKLKLRGIIDGSLFLESPMY